MWLQFQNFAHIDEILVYRCHAKRRVDQCGPQGTQGHRDCRRQKRLRNPRICRNGRRDNHGDNGEPGQRRHRFEYLDQRIERRIHGRRHAHHDAKGSRDHYGQKKAEKDRLKACPYLLVKSLFARIGNAGHIAFTPGRDQGVIACSLTLIELSGFLLFLQMILVKHHRLLPNLGWPGDRTKRCLDLGRQNSPRRQKGQNSNDRHDKPLAQ